MNSTIYILQDKWPAVTDALRRAGYESHGRLLCPRCKDNGRERNLRDQAVKSARTGNSYIQPSCSYQCDGFAERFRELCGEYIVTDEDTAVSGGNQSEDKPPKQDERKAPDTVTVNDWRDAFARSNLSLTLKGFGFVLSQYADWHTGEHIHPGENRLKQEHNISARTAERHSAELLKRGWLKQTFSGKGNAGKRTLANEYKLAVP